MVPLWVELRLIDFRRVIMSAGLHSFTVHPALRRSDIVLLICLRRSDDIVLKCLMRNKSIYIYNRFLLYVHTIKMYFCTVSTLLTPSLL